MASVKGLKRKRKGRKRLDLTDLKHALRDRRCWACLGTVIVPEGESSHFELVEQDGALVDILVDVVTHPGQVELTCRLNSGGNGQALITIPAVDDEVIVIVPEGQIDFAPTIVAHLASGGIPNPGGQGPAPSRTVIVNGEVLVHDGSGGAVELALKSDVSTLKGELDVHIHTTTATIGGGATVGVISPPTNAPYTAPAGTTILKAK